MKLLRPYFAFILLQLVTHDARLIRHLVEGAIQHIYNTQSRFIATNRWDGRICDSIKMKLFKVKIGRWCG